MSTFTHLDNSPLNVAMVPVYLPRGWRVFNTDDARVLSRGSEIFLYDIAFQNVERWTVESYNGSWGQWRLVKMDGGKVDNRESIDDENFTSGNSLFVAVIPVDGADLSALLRESLKNVEMQKENGR